MQRFLLMQVIIVAIVYSGNAELPLHQKPPLLELQGHCGGRLNGEKWSGNEISGKVFSVYYVDPGKADVNEPLFEALKAENFPADKVQSVAIINMKATWMPGRVLSMVLKRKQKKYPYTLYVKDNCRLPVTKWNLTDHSSDILLFNAQGEVIFSRDGKLSAPQIREVVSLIWNSIGGKPADAQK